MVSPAERILAQRILARRRLLQFTKATKPGYQAGWVHEDICTRLEKFSQDVIDEKSPRLMLLMPPRHGKSELASIRLPAWHLGRAPQHEIINASYNLDLPMKFSRKVREVLRSNQYANLFPGTALDPDSQGAEAWNTTVGGGYQAAGVGGGITGKGAHVLIIDDPIKNQEESDNVGVRDKLTDWYESTAYTRLAPGAGILIIETWWNDDDLAGRLQEAMKRPGADQWEVVKYPAISEQYEYRIHPSYEIVRTPTEATQQQILDASKNPAQEAQEIILLRPPENCLHEARYNLTALKRIRSNMQPRIWSALYQQNPVPDEGMYFRKEYLKCMPSYPQFTGGRFITAWDFAITEKQTSDWTVGATLFQDEHDVLYVVDIFRVRGDSFTIVEAMLDIAVRYSDNTTNDYVIGVEDGMIWRSVKPMFERRSVERRISFKYELMKPFTDKLARARPLQGKMQQGRVIFNSEASWFPVTQQELLRFPAGAHDDIVDALAWATRLSLQLTPPQSKQRAYTPPSWKDKLKNFGSIGSSHMSA